MLIEDLAAIVWRVTSHPRGERWRVVVVGQEQGRWRGQGDVWGAPCPLPVFILVPAAALLPWFDELSQRLGPRPVAPPGQNAHRDPSHRDPSHRDPSHRDPSHRDHTISTSFAL